MISVYPQKRSFKFNIISWWFLMGKRDDQPLDFWDSPYFRGAESRGSPMDETPRAEGPGVAQGWRAFPP